MEKLMLNNGKEVELEITFSSLLKLKKNNKEVYEDFMALLNNGCKEFFDYTKILYTAFLCMNENTDMTYDDFLGLLRFNIKEINLVVNSLVYQKKIKTLSEPSKEKTSQDLSTQNLS